MAGYVAWRYSVVENRYHVEIEPNPGSVRPDEMYRICRELLRKYRLHRMQRLTFEAVLEAVKRERRRKEDEAAQALLRNVDVNLG